MTLNQDGSRLYGVKVHSVSGLVSLFDFLESKIASVAIFEIFDIEAFLHKSNGKN